MNKHLDIEQIYNECTSQLSTFADLAGFTDCVIGLSGGMDSSVVTPLCVDAFGADHVHGVLMPGPYSSDHSVEDAWALANALGIEAREIAITKPYEAFADVLADACGGTFEGVASENTQARCRMVVLMALSNQHGWMLVNTGNRSEAYMGYSTLYGDTAGAFAPIGGLFKTQVYELAAYINERALAEGRPAPIPQRVFDKPPSAELSPGQVDEAGLGVDYPTLDAILAGLYDQDLSIEDLADQGFDMDLVEGILYRSERNKFKRALLPPAAKISWE